MPNRIIREALLDSERYWSCTIEARELYRHMQLLADDFGCISLAPAFLGRRCFDHRPTGEKLASLLGQLVDADLIRPYESEGIKYAFIPRFGQRLQRFTLKHPQPPDAVIQGDKHAISLFNRINNVNSNSTSGAPLSSSAQTVPQQPKRSRREELHYARASWWTTDQGIEAKGRELGIPAKGGESYAQYRDRLFASMKAKA